MNQHEYERDLYRRQQEHLAKVQNLKPWQPCAHDLCQNCVGTGIGRLGPCVHALVCNCPKCSRVSM